MMRNSSLLKWTQNNRHGTKNGSTWIHAPEALQRGHVVYLVKFLGNTEVDQPKGLEVVKEGIRKLKFSHQLRKAEGSKTPKVELTISVDGVAIQEPKTKRIMHQYPLHRISYCADDKAEKKFFSFIAKEADVDKHMCFVFVSDKLAEEITLTIGQAFDLAYRKFLETSGRELEMRKQLMILQKRVNVLESEGGALRRRLLEVSQLKDRGDLEEYMRRNQILDLLVIETNGESSDSESASGHNGMNGEPSPPPVPPRAFENYARSGELISLELSPAPSVGTKLEGLLLDDLEDLATSRLQGTSIDTNGVDGVPRLSPPPPKPPRDAQKSSNGDKDAFGADPFNPSSRSGATHGTLSDTPVDPFGMGDFNVRSSLDLENAIGILDKRISEMKAGFSRGIAFENDDFPLESLDPLRNAS